MKNSTMSKAFRVMGIFFMVCGSAFIAMSLFPSCPADVVKNLIVSGIICLCNGGSIYICNS